MAFRELSMTNVKELLLRFQVGESVRSAVRETAADRKTVTRYFEAAEACGIC